MPRGNLEAIYPRSLVLSVVRAHLDKLEFREAFLLMRKQKIDLNLLYDHSPQNFLSHCERFVLSLSDNIDHLNLFLSSLREQDTTHTLFQDVAARLKQILSSASVSEKKTEKHKEKEREKEREKEMEREKERETLSGVQETEKESLTGKVNTVCRALREVFERIDPVKYLLCTITSYARQRPAQLESALLHIKNLGRKKREKATRHHHHHHHHHHRYHHQRLIILLC